MVNKAKKQHVARQLAAQHHKVAQRHDAAEVIGDDNGMRVLSDRIDALAHEVSFHAAGSAEGALYMACLLRSDLESTTADDDRLARIDRLAVSLIQYLEQSTGLRRHDLRLDWFANPDLDGLPFGRRLAAAA